MIRAVAGSSPPQARWPGELEAYVPVPALDDHVVRLAFNESPAGPFPAALAAIASHARAAGRYPEHDGELIGRLAERHRLAPANVALGNGADAIIGHLSAAFLRSGDEMVTGWPSFPTYVTDAAKQGATVRLAPLTDGAVDLDAVAERIGPRTQLVWICTPNNPTGGVVTRAAFRGFIDAVPERVLVVVDEAYHEFLTDPHALDAIGEYVGDRPNVASLRTFSKLYGLAGLRIGYLAGPEPVITAVGRARHYYEIAGLAAVAALASLDSPAEVARRRGLNAERRGQLAAGLARRGLRYLPSHANFLAVNVTDADRLATELLSAGVATRSLAALGAPELLRITVGDERQIDRLLELLAPGGHSAAQA
jgi:histidinol-phosphate aminotransferase